ncbi:hypothetical protein JTB14_008751 [Gonioctena quinquepunctata]|nr:hypothetical protein JTB14_008751 [Gonioctena quinquepunctata]
MDGWKFPPNAKRLAIHTLVLRRDENIYVPEKYREIIPMASRRKQVIDMSQYFRKIHDVPNKLRLVDRKKDELNEKITEPPRDFEIERFHEKYGIISDEKQKNLQEQLKFFQQKYRY